MLTVTEAPSEAVTAQRTTVAATRAQQRRYGMAAALAVGIAFRIFQYAPGRSLWLDEIILAGALLRRSFAELLQPGPWGAVPPGFLIAVKASTLALGSSEYVLRLVPLLGGLAALALFVPVARRYLSPVGAVVAVALFAASPYAIYYAAEAKQYSTDAAVTVGLLLWASALHRDGVTRRRALLLALAGPVFVFFSLPAVFLLGAMLLSLAVRAVREGQRGESRTLGAVGLFWILLLGVPAALVLPRIAGTSYAQGFWSDGFMPFPPRSLGDWLWLPRALTRVFREPLGVMEYSDSLVNMLQIGAGLLAALLGAFALWTRHRRRAVLLALPIVLAIAASALRAYPFGGGISTSGRVLLFLAPIFFLFMAEGIGHLWSRRRAWARTAAAVLLIGTLAPSLAEGATRIPYGRTEMKPLLAYLRDHRQPGDVVYVHYDARPALRYYGERYGLTEANTTRGICSRLQPVQYLNELSKLRGAPRVWVLFATGTGAYGFLESRLMTGFLDYYGKRLDDRVAVGASLFLYDLREKSPPVPAYQVPIPNFPSQTLDDCGFFNSL